MQAHGGTKTAASAGMSIRVVLSLFLRVFALTLLAMPTAQAAVREIATISTNLGEMEFELFSDVSPRAVANFRYLADTKFYDSTAFHRHIAGFMVQGGDPSTRGTTSTGYSKGQGPYGTGGPEYTIPNEPTTRADRAHVRGVLSMAKTGAPDSGGSQFFVMFGDAPWLDNVHAPMGTLIRGAAVLDAIEARPKDANDLPLTPVLIGSVRIRAERTESTPASRMRFPSGTLGGLLRKVDRNPDVCGSYQLTVTSGGAFSAQIQYYGRRNVFTGSMVQASVSDSEAGYVGTLDSSAAVPLRVRLRARQTASSSTSISLSVGGVNADGTDLLDSTLSVAAGEVSPQPSLAERYTAAFEAPLAVTSENGASTSAPAYPDMKGFGFLTVNVRPSSGLALVTGRLQDNTLISLARPVSNEGGRLALPLFFHDLQPSVESQRPVFSSVPLSLWSTDYFNFGVFRLRLVAALELPPKPALPQPSNASGNYSIWYREPKSTGAVKSQIVTYLPVVVAAWTPPLPRQNLAPFSSQTKGQMSADGAEIGSFQIARTNAAGVFDPTGMRPQLRFNPVDGSFQGSFWDTTVESNPRRTFQGVLLQKAGINKGVGFSLTEGASVPVVLVP